MKLGIRNKFLVIVGIASLVPLLIGLLSIQIFGKRQFVRQKGALYETIAQGLASNLTGIISEKVYDLLAWTANQEFDKSMTGLHGLRDQAPGTQQIEKDKIDSIEKRWPALEAAGPELSEVLNNPLARALKSFQASYPLYVEIFVTDARGDLIAATNKTSDYWQADEQWWQEAVTLKPGETWLSGIQYDESARVYSLDVAVPVFSADGSAPSPVGVLKAVLNISPLLGSLKPYPHGEHQRCEVVMDDGRILSGLFGETVQPLTDRIPGQAAQSIHKGSSGWTICPLGGKELELVGFATLDLGEIHASVASIAKISPMQVIVHDRLDEILGPIQKVILLFIVVGALVFSIFMALGLWFAGRNILRPLRILDAAAQGILERAEAWRSAGAPIGRERRLELERLDAQTGAKLAPLEQVRTGDELEHLARGFSHMAHRVLHYHRQLESEIEQRSEQIEQDLKIAREFLEAFLPKEYPHVPAEPSTDSIGLGFSHVYKPAASVSGDFFEVIQLDAHRVGIFLTDVMGHGARSALVTAMLRTLLQNLNSKAASPARLLQLINQHFYQLLPHLDSVIFATAFYMLIDTQKMTATYACAGHPPPIFVDRTRQLVGPLLEQTQCGSALGLVIDSTYTNQSRPVQPGDLFLLYTDGVIEAQNPANEEFGLDGLRRLISENLDKSAHEMNESIVSALEEFMDTAVSPDDICLLGIEVKDRNGRAGAEVTTGR